MNNGFSATHYQIQQKKAKSYPKSYRSSHCWPYHKSPRSEAEPTWDGTYEYYCIKRLDVTKYLMNRTLCELYIYVVKIWYTIKYVVTWLTISATPNIPGIDLRYGIFHSGMLNVIIAIDYNPIYQCTVNALILISATPSSLRYRRQVINNLDDCLILNAIAQYT